MSISVAPKKKATRETRSNLWFALVIVIPVVVYLVLVVGYPLGYALWMSFHQIGFFGGYRADFVGGENYAGVLGDKVFWSGLRISVRLTFETVVATLAIGLGLALVLRRLSGPWSFLRVLIILPWAVSPYGAGILFSNLGRGQTGIGTSIAALFGYDGAVNLVSSQFVIELLALGAAWNMAPLLAFFLLANMLTIPERLYDLARVDQMSPWETFIHVTLPPLRFTLFVFTSITTVLTLKTLDYIVTATKGGPGTASSVLTYELYKISFNNLDLGYGAAMSFYLLALIIAVTGLIYVFWGRREEQA